MNKMTFLTEEQVVLLSTDLSELIKKFENNITSSKKIIDVTNKMEDLENKINSSLLLIENLVKNTETKNDEITNFVKNVALSNNRALLEEISNNYSENKKTLDKYWKETKEQLLLRKKELLETSENISERFENIFSDDMLSQIIQKNLEKEYNSIYSRLDTTINTLNETSVKVMENTVNEILTCSKEIKKAKDTLNMATVIVDDRKEKKGILKGVFFGMLTIIVFLSPILFFFTPIFDAIKSDRIILNKSSFNTNDKKIINFNNTNFYILDNKEDYIILKKLGN